MPGERISISTANYPELKDLAQGDNISLNISGKIAGNDGDMVEIETTSIETQKDEAGQFMKKMMKQPEMEGGYDNEDEEA